MGFFKNIFKFRKKSFKPIFRAALAGITVGGTEAARLVASSIKKGAGDKLGNIQTRSAIGAAKGFVQGGYVGAAIGAVVEGAQQGLAEFGPQKFRTQPGAKPMALNIGGILGTVGSVLGSTNATNNPYVSGLSGVLQIASTAFAPTQRAAAPAMTVASRPATSTPTVIGASASVRGLTQDIVNIGNKLLGRLGISVRSISAFSPTLKRAIGSIASFARRTPSGTIVSVLAGMGLTALEANTITAWYSQRKKSRRMNPCNAKALRRAARRIRSFHKLAIHTDLLKTHHHRAPTRHYGRKH